jgi:hypothetical protein
VLKHTSSYITGLKAGVLRTQLINKNYNRELKLEINRNICNYNTKIGKDYQKVDTDVLLLLDCKQTKKKFEIKVSEKTRNKYYDDIYMEVISSLKWNNKTKRYEIHAPGWGLKNDQLSPDCLSLLFLNKNENTYHNIFINKYKKLKTELFNKDLLNNIENGKIENWLNKLINLKQNKEKKGFKYSIESQNNNKNNNNIKEIIFAKNKEYITVGFTFSMNYIKSLVPVNEYHGRIIIEPTSHERRRFLLK